MSKSSKPRESMIKILQSTDTHPTAEWIYQRLREEFPRVSLATIYRNLKKLTQMGVIREIYMADSSRFDANMSEHYHFICSKCKRVIDVIPEGAPVDFSTLRNNGFKIDNYVLSIYGTCQSCKEEEEKQYAQNSCDGV